MERLLRLRRGGSRRESASTAAGATSGSGTQTPVAEVSRTVEVIYGAGVQTLALAGLTVGQARPLVETILAVDPRSPALVNGRPARSNYVIVEGDALEFVHHAGEKGASRLLKNATC